MAAPLAKLGDLPEDRDRARPEPKAIAGVGGGAVTRIANPKRTSGRRGERRPQP